MKIDILKKADITQDVEVQICTLFKQLSSGINQVPLKKVFEQEAQITLAYCSIEGHIIGMALMCTYSVISGNKAWIEDVVVDQNYRGKGIGRKLIEKLLMQAKKRNISEILLFTADHRKAAIELYKSFGFKYKDSKIYRLRFD